MYLITFLSFCHKLFQLGFYCYCSIKPIIKVSIELLPAQPSGSFSVLILPDLVADYYPINHFFSLNHLSSLQLS